MKIIHWNIRSLPTNYNSLRYIIHKYKPDIICLNETFLRQHHNINIPWYTIIRQDRPDGYGGIATLIHTKTPFKEIFINNITPHNLQVMGIQLQHFKLFNIYCPPRVDGAQIINTILQTEEDPYIIVGDFNSQNPIWGSGTLNSNGRNLAEVIEKYDLVILNDGRPTRLTNPTQYASAPDVTICSRILAPWIEWDTLEEMGSSDHIPIFLKYHEHPESQTHTERKRTGWPSKTINWEKFHNILTEKHNIPNYLQIKQTIVEAVQGSVMIKKPQQNSKKFPPNPPWWNETCTCQIKRRQAALRKYRSDPTLENFLDYKRTVAVTRRALRKQKKDSFRKFCESINKDTEISKIWRIVNAFNKNKKRKTQQTTLNNDWIHKMLDHLAPPGNT